MFRTTSDILCKDGDLHASSMMVEITMRVIPSGQQLVVLQGATIDIDREHGIHVLIGLDTALQNMNLVLEVQQADHALWWGFVHDGGGNHLVHQLGVFLCWRNLGREPSYACTVDIARDECHADLAVVGKVLKTRDELVALSLVRFGYMTKIGGGGRERERESGVTWLKT